jgi:hypothetical protein
MSTMIHGVAVRVQNISQLVHKIIKYSMRKTITLIATSKFAFGKLKWFR